jgi:hypothetical protein
MKFSKYSFVLYILHRLAHSLGTFLLPNEMWMRIFLRLWQVRVLECRYPTVYVVVHILDSGWSWAMLKYNKGCPHSCFCVFSWGGHKVIIPRYVLFVK